MRRIIFSLFSVVIIVAVALPAVSGIALADDPYVSVNKTAVPVAGCCRYEVTLTITGSPPTKPVDVILVIDRSGSMGPGYGNDIVHAKDAAIAFAQRILPVAGSNNRVGVVSYSTSASLDQALTSDLEGVIEAINGLNTGGYTNIEAGFNTASNHMQSDGRPEASRAIVLLSDGVANREAEEWWWGCTTWPTDHTDCTIAAYQAGQSAQSQALVFTVGLFGGLRDSHPECLDVASDTLERAQDRGYWEISEAAELTPIFNEIATQVMPAATEVVVTDVVSEEFEIDIGSLTPSQGTVSVSGNTITWNVGTVGDTPETLTYEVTAEPGYSGPLQVNDSATMNYTDAYGTPDQSLTFPLPTVDVPGIPSADAGADKEVCQGSSVTIGGGPTASGGTPDYSYSWSPSDGLDDPTSSNPTASPTSTTTYTVTVTDDNGCTDSDSMILTVNPKPSADAGADKEVCQGSSVVIGGSPTASGGTPDYSYSWSPSDGLDDPTSSNPTASPTTTTTYTVTVTGAKGCTDSDSMTVTVNPKPSADAGADKEISSGGSVEIGGSPTASGGTSPYTYSWTPSAGLDDPTNANPTASPNTTTTYTVTITDDSGCSDTDVMVLTVTTPPPAVGGGGMPAVRRCYLYIDMLGEITRVRIGCRNNRVLESYLAPDPDDLHFLVIEEGTAVICGDVAGYGNYPEIIVMSLVEEPPPAPDGMVIVGPVYDFTGYRDKDRRDLVCSPVTLDPPITVILSYDPDELPEGAFSPVVTYYDEEEGCWVVLPPDTGRVAEIGKVTGLADKFSLFTILAELPPPPPPPTPAPSPPLPPPPAHFVASDLTIVPSLERIEIERPVTLVVKIGESVTITANVANDGGQEGSYVADLKINGQTQDTKEITLRPGQSQQIVFGVTDNEPGHYVVQIGELSGEFQALVWVNWWLIGGLIAAYTLLVWLAWYYGYRRRKR